MKPSEETQRLIIEYEARERAQAEALRELGATEREIERIRYRYPMGAADTPAETLAAYRGMVAEQAAHERRKLRAQLVRAGFPEKHLRLAFDAVPDETDAIKKAREFITTDATFLVLLGGNGVGKTTAAVWAAANWSQPSWSYFIDAREIARIGGFGEEERTLRDKLDAATLLVLDDVGREHVDRGWFASNFEGLINRRYNACAKAIISGNITVDEFAQKYGKVVYERVKETGRVWYIGGESMRKQQTFRPLPNATDGNDDGC